MVPLAPEFGQLGKHMKARVKWVENVQFEGQSGSGHTVMMDGAPELGGRDLGCRPMELLLLGLGGCTAFDVVSILTKSREAIQGCEVEIDAERAPSDPKVFTRIHTQFIVRGTKLSADKVKRAIALSAEKYCSASIMLGKTAQITHDFEIQEA